MEIGLVLINPVFGLFGVSGPNKLSVSCRMLFFLTWPAIKLKSPSLPEKETERCTVSGS